MPRPFYTQYTISHCSLELILSARMGKDASPIPHAYDSPAERTRGIQSLLSSADITNATDSSTFHQTPLRVVCVIDPKQSSYDDQELHTTQGIYMCSIYNGILSCHQLIYCILSWTNFEILDSYNLLWLKFKSKNVNLTQCTKYPTCV